MIPERVCYLCSAFRRFTQRRAYCSTAPTSEAHDAQIGHEFSPRTQKSIPQYRQLPVQYNGDKHIQVGFLLARQPVVMPDVHPLEHELSNLLQGEYNVYNRHRVGFELDEIASQGTTPKLSGKKMKAVAQSNVKRNISSSSQNFWKERGMTLDQWGRTDDGAKKSSPDKKEGKRKDKKETQTTEPSSGNFMTNFFNLEAYADGQRVVANNWSPASRFTQSDFSDIRGQKTFRFALGSEASEDPANENSEATSSEKSVNCTVPNFASRHTTSRRYQDFLYFLVLNAQKQLSSAEGVALRWSIPYGPRKQGESLRSTLDRLLVEFTRNGTEGEMTSRKGKFSFYVPSNAPQGVLYENKDLKRPVYVFIVHYSEEPNLHANINTPADTANVLGIDTARSDIEIGGERTPIDYNWVSRTEMSQYDFHGDGTQSLLEDITVDGVGE